MKNKAAHASAAYQVKKQLDEERFQKS